MSAALANSGGHTRPPSIEIAGLRRNVQNFECTLSRRDRSELVGRCGVGFLVVNISEDFFFARGFFEGDDLFSSMGSASAFFLGGMTFKTRRELHLDHARTLLDSGLFCWRCGSE